MARIAGVNIPTAKRVPIALTYITGIGPSSAKSICEAVKIDEKRRVNELSDAEVLAIREGDPMPGSTAEVEAIVKRLQRVRHVSRAVIERSCRHGFDSAARQSCRGRADRKFSEAANATLPYFTSIGSSSFSLICFAECFVAVNAHQRAHFSMV